MSQSLNHASPRALALQAAGDLPWYESIAVRWHLRHCEECREEVAAFDSARAFVGAEPAELPVDLHWDRLAAEMKANIALGFAAGECVGPAPVEAAVPFFRSPAFLSAAGVCAAVAVIYAGTMAMRQRASDFAAPQPESQEMTLQAKPGTLEIRGNGSAFSIVRASTAPTVLSVGTGGSLGARDIDEDTGQVTIYRVFTDEDYAQ